MNSLENEWRELPFDEAVIVNPKVALKKGELYPFVEMSKLDSTSRLVQTSERREYTGGGSKFENGDTLMARITPCLENGKISRYKSDSTDSRMGFGSTEFIVIRGRDKVTDNDFTYYLTCWSEFRNYAIGQMNGSSGRQRVPTTSLSGFLVTLPPLPVQKKIASVLSSLDDKIELNTRMNKVLEEIARALFHRWFVEFEFPDAEGRPYKSSGGKMVESEMGSVPEGWAVGKIGDICYRKRNLVEPISLREQLPYIGLEHMPQHHMVLDRWGCSGDINSTKIEFSENDILFGTLRPYFHKVGLSPINGICSTDILVVSPIEAEYLSLVLCYVSSDEFVAYANSASEGTRMPRAKWDHMKMYSVVIPSKETVILFNVIINSILSQIKENIMMNCCLKEIQNKLLPKLMSGEIEV